MPDCGLVAIAQAGWASGSLRRLTAMILTGMPTQTAWTGGMSAAAPTSSALAWKASVTAGPPVMRTHFTWNGRSRSQPVICSTFWVVGSPMLRVTPDSACSGRGAVSARLPAAAPPFTGLPAARK